MEQKRENNAMHPDNIQYDDEEILDGPEREVLEALRHWMHTTEIPESSDDPVIEKIYQMPLVLDAVEYRSKEEETSIKEKVDRIFMHEIIPDLRMLSHRVGQNASEVIKKAKRSVHVTHFSKESLPDDYILRMRDLLEHGITVTRIVYFHESYLDNYRWLKSFRKDGKLLPGYHELVHRGEPTPMDLVIVDDREALLSFPIHPDVPEFFDAVVINESSLVRACRTVFTFLHMNSMKIEEAQDDTRLGVPNYLEVLSEKSTSLKS